MIDANDDARGILDWTRYRDFDFFDRQTGCLCQDDNSRKCDLWIDAARHLQHAMYTANCQCGGDKQNETEIRVGTRDVISSLARLLYAFATVSHIPDSQCVSS